jgi:hypothetical protein
LNQYSNLKGNKDFGEEDIENEEEYDMSIESKKENDLKGNVY